ncbi:O-fucosyltransferase 2-like [Tasmannia lanceolata]|uniref:O-fucosyltransferase 2-like n=1 Tax=Tasmannia lanceolata TaxID=3420 RepID=UPI0040647FF6
MISVNGGERGDGSSSFHSLSHPTTPRSRPASPRSPTSKKMFRDFGFSSTSSFRTRLSNTGISNSKSPFSSLGFIQWWKLWSGSKLFELWFPWGFGNLGFKQQQRVKRKGVGFWYWERVRVFAAGIGVVVLFFLMIWWMLLSLQDPILPHKGSSLNQTSSSSSSSLLIRGEWSKFGKGKRPQRVMYSRLLALAAHAMAEGENKPEPRGLWEEPLVPASSWTPCADQRNWEACEGNNGYILISANGGISQQRVAVCNAVAIARLLNSTLVLPKFLYSSVWRDGSQFSDIYQEEHFMSYLKADIRIVKELPIELQSLDLEAIGSIVSDEEIMKEAKPSFFRKNILPILLRNRVVHFIGFGNRLSFDPIPYQLQRLRCRCNFHALRFVPKIQETGALIVQRMRQHIPRWGLLDHNLMGPFAAKSNTKATKNLPKYTSRYLALHLRFEIDMAAHSLCDFGGGEEERKELEAYREIHFPALTLLLKNSTKLPSASVLRSEGRCPLTPEEAVLMLAALGFNRKTHIYLASAHIYGGKSRMAALSSLYPNLVTKENLLSSSEIEPFLNFSSQLAALDFIGCAAADAFAITDSGSQLSSLVSGYRIYYGGGKLPTIRPNKRRLAGLYMKNTTIEWQELGGRIRKAVRQSKKVHERPVARSIYRHPRCPECMCKTE